MIFISYICNWTILFYIMVNHLGKKYKLTKSKATLIFTCIIFILVSGVVNLLNITILHYTVKLICYIILTIYFYEKYSLLHSLYDIIYFITLLFITFILSYLIDGVYTGTDKITRHIVYSHINSIILLSLFETIYIMKNKDEFHYTLLCKLAIYFLASVFSIIAIYLIADTIVNPYLLFISIGLIGTNIIINYLLKNDESIRKLQYQLKEERKHYKLKNQYFLQIKKHHEDTQKLIHDSKNQLLAIKIAYQTNNMTLADSITNSFYNQYENPETYYYSSSDILNIIIYEKNAQALKHNIAFDFKSDKIDYSFINDFDMITIFGNIYDNAIEANNNISDTSDKFIETTIFKVHDMLNIKVINSCSNKINYHRKNIISTKANHMGIGIHNIKKTIHKYNGIFTIKNDGRKCIVMISIPCKDN